MKRQDKKQELERLKGEFAQAASVVFAEHTGLTVAESQALRKALRTAGGGCRVSRNTLMRLALGDAVADQLGAVLTGPTTYAWHPEDPSVPARIFKQFADEHPKLVLKGGVVDGIALDSRGVTNLASMPSKPELFSQLLGIILTPGTQLATAVNGVGTKLAGTIKAYEEKLAESAA